MWVCACVIDLSNDLCTYYIWVSYQSFCLQAAWEDLNDGHIKTTVQQTVGTQDGDAKVSVMHCDLPMLLAESGKAFTVPTRQIDVNANATAVESVQHLEEDDIT